MRWIAAGLLVLLVGCSPSALRPSASPAVSPAASPSPAGNEARNATVQWWFRSEQQDAPDAALASAIREARTEVDAAIYALNRDTDVQALQTAYGQCECVRIITDAEQSKSDPRQTAALDQLQSAGVPIKIDSHAGLMHDKMLEVDHRFVVTGSFNWTNAASTVNDENLWRINSSEAATAAAKLFDSMWNDTRRYKNWQAPQGTVTPVPALSRF